MKRTNLYCEAKIQKYCFMTTDPQNVEIVLKSILTIVFGTWHFTFINVLWNIQANIFIKLHPYKEVTSANNHTVKKWYLLGYYKSEYEGSPIGNGVIHHSNVFGKFLHYNHHKFIHLQIKQGHYWTHYFMKETVFNSRSSYMRIIRYTWSRNAKFWIKTWFSMGALWMWKAALIYLMLYQKCPWQLVLHWPSKVLLLCVMFPTQK